MFPFFQEFSRPSIPRLGESKTIPTYTHDVPEVSGRRGQRQGEVHRPRHQGSESPDHGGTVRGAHLPHAVGAARPAEGDLGAGGQVEGRLEGLERRGLQVPAGESGRRENHVFMIAILRAPFTFPQGSFPYAPGDDMRSLGRLRGGEDGEVMDDA